MADKKPNEQQEQDELRDLDVPEKDAEGVKGGLDVASSEVFELNIVKAAPPKPKSP